MSPLAKVPNGEISTHVYDNSFNFKETRVKEARKAAFVCVAGGLGERPGYNGIKVALPAETTSWTCFLPHYIELVLPSQKASCRLAEDGCGTQILFVIMTSNDPHARTLHLLKSNDFLGMQHSQVKLLKQEKVACLEDNDTRVALEPHDKYKIQTKPHGHGDVHALLYPSGLLNLWHDANMKWVLLFQDTNGLLFKAIPATLGVSAIRQFHVHYLDIYRKAKEPIGRITKLTHADGRTMEMNVEYDQLYPLPIATGHPDGDVNDEAGFFSFPVSKDHLTLECDLCIEELEKKGGPKFVKPKHKDASTTSFKSSARQDLAPLKLIFAFLFFLGQVSSTLAASTVVFKNNRGTPISISAIRTNGSSEIDVSSRGTISPGNLLSATVPDGWTGYFVATVECNISGLGTDKCTCVDWKGQDCTSDLVATALFVSNDSYMLSTLMGFNVGMTILPGCGRRSSASCIANLASCPKEMAVFNGSGTVVGCKPGGLEFSSSQCVTSEDYSPEVTFNCPRQVVVVGLI